MLLHENYGIIYHKEIKRLLEGSMAVMDTNVKAEIDWLNEQLVYLKDTFVTWIKFV
ncbi:MAG: hypothetical protein FWG49_08370 [Leptospirales bacterium]|nr:hypothetical protein [Leptospirales bacterium]